MLNIIIYIAESGVKTPKTKKNIGYSIECISSRFLCRLKVFSSTYWSHPTVPASRKKKAVERQRNLGLRVFKGDLSDFLWKVYVEYYYFEFVWRFSNQKLRLYVVKVCPSVKFCSMNVVLD
jgi:hypothetical protein